MPRPVSAFNRWLLKQSMRVMPARNPAVVPPTSRWDVLEVETGLASPPGPRAGASMRDAAFKAARFLYRQQDIAQAAALYGVSRGLGMLAPDAPREGAPTVFFTSSRGKVEAPVAVRCVEFGKVLRQRGWNTHVWTFWDDVLELKGMSDRERHAFPATCAAYMSVLTELRLLEVNGPRVLYMQRPRVDGLFLADFARRQGFKIVIDVDDWFMDEQAVGTVQVHDVIEALRGKVDSVIVSSHRLEGYFRQRFDDVVLVPTGVDLDGFPPRAELDRVIDARVSRRGPVVITWAGTIFERYQAEAVMMAVQALWAAMKRVDVEVRLEILGDGALRPMVEKRVAADYPHVPVFFRGWRPKAEVLRHLVHEADIGLFPLPWDADFTSSKSPTKIFEYMAAGLPVVASALGEAAHVLGDGSGVLASSMEDWADAFTRLIRDPRERQRLGRAGREAAEHKWQLRHLVGGLDAHLRGLLGH